MSQIDWNRYVNHINSNKINKLQTQAGKEIQSDTSAYVVKKGDSITLTVARILITRGIEPTNDNINNVIEQLKNKNLAKEQGGVKYLIAGSTINIDKIDLNNSVQKTDSPEENKSLQSDVTIKSDFQGDKTDNSIRTQNESPHEVLAEEVTISGEVTDSFEFEGQKCEIRGGKCYINGKEVPRLAYEGAKNKAESSKYWDKFYNQTNASAASSEVLSQALLMK